MLMIVMNIFSNEVLEADLSPEFPCYNAEYHDSENYEQGNSVAIFPIEGCSNIVTSQRVLVVSLVKNNLVVEYLNVTEHPEPNHTIDERGNNDDIDSCEVQ